MLLMTSIISPSTAAALLAKSSCNGLPAAARRNIATTMPPAMTINTPAIERLTVAIRLIAAIVAKHGGNTFQTNMFSTVKIALDVAVIRLVSISGSRAEKKHRAGGGKW